MQFGGDFSPVDGTGTEFEAVKVFGAYLTHVFREIYWVHIVLRDRY